MNFRAVLLFPLTLIYILITVFRNHLFNIGYSRSFNYNIMTINVGNLSVGGTGKTPMVEYLIQLLKHQYAIATLSRGYKRKSNGFLIANTSSSVQDLGDEPYQFYLKFKEHINVAVGEDRSLAISRILMEKPKTQLVILDDAYQHRTVTPDFNILLTQFSSPFYKDFVLPSGNLREKRSEAKRADVIIVTKCPLDISESLKMETINSIKKYTPPNTSIYFTAINYAAPLPYSPSYKFLGNVILFAGLANIIPLQEYVASTFNLLEVVNYKDHHDYSLNDLKNLSKKAKKHNVQLLTTEKDIVKIKSNQLYDTGTEKIGLFYLPISVQFLFEERLSFNSLVNKAMIRKYK